MKKLSAVSLLLCLLLVLQLLFVPALATGSDTTEETVPETLPSAEGETAPVAAFGTATVLSGCRTFNARVPLSASENLLDTAVAALAYERNTGTLVYAHNPDQEVQPGTLTKLVAAIVAIEKGNLEDKVTVNSQSYKSLPAGAKTADPYLTHLGGF